MSEQLKVDSWTTQDLYTSGGHVYSALMRSTFDASLRWLQPNKVCNDAKFALAMYVGTYLLWASICLQVVSFYKSYLLQAKARSLYVDELLPKSGVIFGKFKIQIFHNLSLV